MPEESIGETVHVRTADHPPRTDSPEYVATRKWLMGVIAGGCYICGGPADTSHPEVVGDSKGLEDHHGGGINIGGILVAFNLFPAEWSMGWGADPVRYTAFVEQLIESGLLKVADLAAAGIALPLKDVAAVMAWVDSRFNANVKLCKPHHTGHQMSHSPDVNGHEAVGIHNAPWPILSAQAFWDWSRGDLWMGTTGTLAGSPRADGSAMVTYVHHSHPEPLRVGQVLPATHPHARALHTPVKVAA